jgi:hypothetical protein
LASGAVLLASQTATPDKLLVKNKRAENGWSEIGSNASCYAIRSLQFYWNNNWSGPCGF